MAVCEWQQVRISSKKFYHALKCWYVCIILGASHSLIICVKRKSWYTVIRSKQHVHISHAKSMSPHTQEPAPGRGALHSRQKDGRRWEKGVDSWNKYVHCSTRPHSWSHKRFPCFTLYFPLAFWIVQENYTFVKSEYSNNNTDTVNSPRDHSFNVLQFLYSVRGRTMTD